MLALGAVAAVAATLVVGGDRYFERHTVKIDETVSIVTLDDYAIVMQRGQTPQVTRVRPPVAPVRNVRLETTSGGASATLRWTLPFSCANAKYYNAHFTRAQLEAMRKAAGMALPTSEQRAQIQACLAGRIQ